MWESEAPPIVTRNNAFHFAKYTQANLEYVAAAPSSSGAHPVTQLTNSLLGLIVFPWEKGLRPSTTERRLSGLERDGWPHWTFHLGRRGTLRDLLWHVRNAIAHGRLAFSSDSDDLASVVLEFSDRPNAPGSPDNWRVRITAADLLKFCLRYAMLIQDETG